LDVSEIYSECHDSAPLANVADALLRQEPEEDEEDESDSKEDDHEDGDDEDDDDEDGYSE
jgi:hypothetical protein